MKRILVIDYSDLPRPELKTPAKGTDGDRTDESQADETRVDYILRKYNGDLSVLAGWKSRGKYGDAPVNNLEDAFEVLRNAHDDFMSADGLPFETFAEALAAIGDGTFVSKVRDFNTRVNAETETTTPPTTGTTENEKK